MGYYDDYDNDPMKDAKDRVIGMFYFALVVLAIVGIIYVIDHWPFD